MKKIYERKVVEQGEFIKFLVFFKIGKGTTKKKIIVLNKKNSSRQICNPPLFQKSPTEFYPKPLSNIIIFNALYDVVI